MFVKGINMSKIQSINSINNKPLLSANNTGYAALTGLVLTTGAAIVKNKNVKKFHKPLAYLTGVLTLLHLGTILHNRNEWKKKQKELNALG